MSILRKSRSYTVRSQSPRGLGKWTYLLIFALTGVGAYRWGLASAERSKSPRRYTATAAVCHANEFDSDRASGGSAAAAEVQLGGIREQILLEANLLEVIRDVGGVGDSASGPLAEDGQFSAAGRAATELRRNLRIEASETSSPDEMRLSFAYSSPRRDFAVGIVNTLAQRYSAEYRARCKELARQDYIKARETSGRAERASTQADARLDSFFESHFKRSGAVDEQALRIPDSTRALAGSVRPPGPVSPPSEPVLVDNPNWVALAERLGELQRRQAELLIDRTPFHPQVRDNAMRIEIVDRQLAKVPRKVPGPPPGAPTPRVEAPSVSERFPGARTAQEYAMTVEQFRQLKAAAEQAGKICAEVSRVEREAWFRYQQEPPLKLELAEPIDPVPAWQPGPELILAALTAAMAMTCAVGMVGTGVAMEPTIGSIAQARGVLPVPVVGSIPKSGVTGRRRRLRRWQGPVRLSAIGGGVALMVACATLLARAFGN